MPASAYNHPEPEERQPAPLAIVPAAPSCPVNLTLHSEISALLAQTDGDGKPALSQNRLAHAINMAPAALSQWLALPDRPGQPFKHDLSKLESRLDEYLRRAGTAAPGSEALTDTAITRHFAGMVNLVHSNRDFGLYWGPAGVGKSIAAAQYVAANPLARLISVRVWSGGADAIKSSLWKQFSTRSWTSKMGSQMDWLRDRISKSCTVLIFDNAHRLTARAIAWLMDLHDECGVPVLLVGNPEVLDKLRRADEQAGAAYATSRLGICRQASWGKAARDNIAKAAEFILQRELPDGGAELRSEAIQIAAGTGALRALKKHLSLVRDLRASSPGLGLPALLATARQQLVNDQTVLA